MAQEPKMVSSLRTVEDLNRELEQLNHDVKHGRCDNKAADVRNTIIKAGTYLNVKLKMDYMKLYLQAKIKKVELPNILMLDTRE